jgi:3-hydroxy acid dehydrogenase/malonic semialdehyde reductase
MSRNLAGKTVLITGASAGIGRSTALEFARSSPKDLKLILTARRVERLEDLKKEIVDECGAGVKVHIVKLDVSNPEEIDRFVGELPEGFRSVDVLVNNAGFMSGVEQPPDIPRHVIQDVYATNVFGVINMTQAILPIFKARPDGGKGDIIMLGSIASRDPYVGGTIYCSSKAAVAAFTDALRKEMIGTRIRIMTVDPGQVQTEFNLNKFRGDQSKVDDSYAGRIPLTPDDVAEVIVFAASRNENVVVADTLLFPSYQASATHIHSNA